MEDNRKYDIIKALEYTILKSDFNDEYKERLKLILIDLRKLN